MMTGDQYKASLDDGRETYFDGERIESVVGHPIFSPCITAATEGYDRFFKPGSDAISDYMTIPRSAEALREQAQTPVDGLMGYTYVSLMTLLTAGDRIAEKRPQGREAIQAYVRDMQARDLRITECITDAKGDRSRPPAKQDDRDAYVHVVDRKSDGVVIRGAKLHISLASIGHELMTIPTKAMKPNEQEYAIACAVPVNAPGVKIVNVGAPPHDGDPRDFPFSAKHSIPQGFVIFDNVFVPYDRVFLDGETEFAASFAHSLGLWTRASSLANMADEADMMVGLAQLITEANGLERVSHIKDKIAEMAIHATLIRATLEASFANCHISEEGVAVPDEVYTNAGKYQGAAYFSLMTRHLHDIAGGSALTVPSTRDLENPETGHLLRKYMGTKQSVDGAYRVKLFQAIRDFSASAYAGYRAVSTIQGGGGLFAQRTVTRGRYDMTRAKRLALEAAGIEHPDQ